jgi:hypothetical protein
MSDAREPVAGEVAEATGVGQPGEVGEPVEDRPAAPADEAVQTAADPVPAWEPDEVLLGSVALAQRALLEVTPPETVGSPIGHVADGEHVLSLHFAADLTGYPGWHWSVTLARVEDGEPTVLETELLPGERALLAPEWVPWSERLADYRAAQAAAAADAAAHGDAEGDEIADEAGVTDVDDQSLASDDIDDETDDDEYGDDADDAEFADEADDGDDDDVFDGIDIDALDDAAPDDEDDDEGPSGSAA